MSLYCENHRVLLADRGGMRIIGQFENLTRVRWGRIRDDFSEASIVIAQPTADCMDLLRQVHPNRHELVIFRGSDRVWEGPVTLIQRKADTFTISARDVIHYLYRTVCHFEHDNAGRWIPDGNDPNRVFQDNTGPVVDRVLNMLQTELATREALDPPINVVPHIIAVRADTIADERESTRRTLAYQTTVYDDMESSAATGGLDYTAVGRRIILNDTRVRIGQTPVITEEDLLSEIEVSSYGMESFTRAFTTGDIDENGDLMVGVYPPIATGHPDADLQEMIDYYGIWENLEQMFDEDSVEAPTQYSLNRAARYNMNERLPVPTLIHVPDNSEVNPNGLLSLRDLVPGVIVPVRAELPSITVVQNLRLSAVKVEEDPSREAIFITLVAPPAEFLPSEGFPA